jgi:hypothetical protein
MGEAERQFLRGMFCKHGHFCCQRRAKRYLLNLAKPYLSVLKQNVKWPCFIEISTLFLHFFIARTGTAKHFENQVH